MAPELNLRFPDASHVIVRLGEDESGELPFNIPLADKDLRDLAWYVETYGAHSLGDPDDREATRIAGQLPAWGEALFSAVFTDRAAQRLFNSLQDGTAESRLLTISAEHPDILALPWELLRDPAAGGGFLFMETPRISIRRRVAGATGGRAPFKAASKRVLHLLFVVSRPADAGFLDPRADSLPVLDALDQHAPGCVTWEFLLPPTLDALIQRLEDRSRKPIDILHFDGHGVFDRHGNLPNRAAFAQSARIARLEEILRDKKAEVPVDPNCPPQTGYLLFEKSDGTADFVSAEKLGANLSRHEVGLVILSACQSAAIGSEEKAADRDTDRPMGSVAARLTGTGIPSVLAMTHSVLVATTKTLFGEFYKELARHKTIGEALDNARRHLANHPEKYEVQRGPARVKLKLYDWFLPALYQQGADAAPLERSEGSKQLPEIRSNLARKPEAGFFGRRRTLWEIERWFASSTRRITLTGFGGQGKTALAQECGRWLGRTGMFEAAVFVDYSRVQAADAVAVAKNEIGRVFDETFVDGDSVTAALKQTPTLVILDNLEALAPASLRALLDAAVPWSTAGGSRVLCTTRRPDFGHADYRIEGTNVHRRIQLDGLGSKSAPDDALEWCAALMKLPPAPIVPAPNRDALIDLFDHVRFHPLSIRVVAEQLKTRRVSEVGSRLQRLLADGAQSARDPQSVASEDIPAELLASLELSLDQLDDAARDVLPRLGVFQGGAFEDDLCAITGLSDPFAQQREGLESFLAACDAGKATEFFEATGRPVPNDEELTGLVARARAHYSELPPPTANLWSTLRRQLELAALLEAESIPGVSVPFLRFHPTLAPMLWARLDASERARLTIAHRKRYLDVAGYLYEKDERHPHQVRAIVWRELPNLLHAVHATLDATDPDALDFCVEVGRFLSIFGLKQEAERLSSRAQQTAGEVGSRAWYLKQSHRGEYLFGTGQLEEAAQVFQIMLRQLGDSPTYDRAVTLARLGQCLVATGRPDSAVQAARDGIAVCSALKQTDLVTRQRGLLLTNLADALLSQGRVAEARQAYQDGLKLDEELRDLRAQGVSLGQLGTLAMREGDLEEAAERHRAALALFQRLREPAMEAVAWHQLGRVLQQANQLDEAERHYRESARIEEARGNLVGAAQTWNQLARLSEIADKPDAAEVWYRKAIEGFRASRVTHDLSMTLSNLASLLLARTVPLIEARQLAEESLAIKLTLDPSAAQAWKTYGILARIAQTEAECANDASRRAELKGQALEYHHLARESRRNFAGTKRELRRYAGLIRGTFLAVQDADRRRQLENALLDFESRGRAKLEVAIRRILAGERDGDTLCADLDLEESMIIDAVLAGLRDPQTLDDLLPPDASRDK